MDNVMDKETLSRKIIELIEPITNFHGAELVRVKLIGTLSKPTVQIMAERPNATMDLGLCETLSREYSLLLDVEDIIQFEYTLEVSSPGIDRPLTRFKDFERWHNFETIIDLAEKYEGRRKLKGILQKPVVPDNGLHDFTVTIQEETGLFSVPFSKISEAKLVLSDALLKATENGAKLHGFAYDDDSVLSNIEIEVDDKDSIKKMARKNKPKKIEEIEEIVTLKCEGE
jgi:ribosome maturation factor RimP